MLKIEKFTDVCMTGGMHCTHSHTNVCKFYNFQVTFFLADISPEMLKLGRVTKVKMLFLVLVFVFNIDLFKFSAAILEKGLFPRAYPALETYEWTLSRFRDLHDPYYGN